MTFPQNKFRWKFNIYRKKWMNFILVIIWWYWLQSWVEKRWLEGLDQTKTMSSLFLVVPSHTILSIQFCQLCVIWKVIQRPQSSMSLDSIRKILHIHQLTHTTIQTCLQVLTLIMSLNEKCYWKNNIFLCFKVIYSTNSQHTILFCPYDPPY